MSVKGMLVVAISISNNKLYSHNGEFLKEIACPRRVSKDRLKRRVDHNFDCLQCQRTVVDTDFMSEMQLVRLLKNAPDTCLSINLKNPIFEVGK